MAVASNPCSVGTWGDYLWCNMTGIMTADQQVAAMRGNFGGAADPTLVDQSSSTYAQWLKDNNYNQTISDTLNPISAFTNLFGGVGNTIMVIGAVLVGVLVLGGRR